MSIDCTRILRSPSQAVPFQFVWTTSPSANSLLGDAIRAPIVRVRRPVPIQASTMQHYPRPPLRAVFGARPELRRHRRRAPHLCPHAPAARRGRHGHVDDGVPRRHAVGAPGGATLPLPFSLGHTRPVPAPLQTATRAHLDALVRVSASAAVPASALLLDGDIAFRQRRVDWL